MLATQCVIGDVGEKATTELSLSFKSMVACGGFQYGANSDGLFLLNSGETDGGATFERSVTLATTDFGNHNPKRARFLHFGIEADTAMTLSIKTDDQVWRDYQIDPDKTGLQRVRVPIGRNGYGRYWTIKVSSMARFRLDSVDGFFIIRSTGVRGY